MAATSIYPDGEYLKHSLPLHRGHEVVVWGENDKIGSFCIAWGKTYHYVSENGWHFNKESSLLLTDENYRIHAAGLFRNDFKNAEKLERPQWGICMGPNNGLARFEIIWP